MSYKFLLFGIMAILAACSPATTNKTQMKDCELKDSDIQHMVVFNLPYEEGSAEAQKFMEDGKRILTAIPVVQNFQAFNQVSEKNDYQYGFSMVFANQDDYNTYNEHPDHVAFVQERWLKEVTDFLEIDLNQHH